MRQKFMHRDFWNFYTGDDEFKTTFFLRFKGEAMERLYQQHLISSSIYSMRLLMLALSLLLIYMDGFGSYLMNLWTLVLTQFVIGIVSMCNNNSIFYMYRRFGKFTVDLAKKPLFFSLVCNLVPFSLTHIYLTKY